MQDCVATVVWTFASDIYIYIWKWPDPDPLCAIQDRLGESKVNVIGTCNILHLCFFSPTYNRNIFFNIIKILRTIYVWKINFYSWVFRIKVFLNSLIKDISLFWPLKIVKIKYALINYMCQCHVSLLFFSNTTVVLTVDLSSYNLKNSINKINLIGKKRVKNATYVIV